MTKKASFPQLRFKGFTEAWEQYKLKDLGKSYSGISIESSFNKTGKYKVISIGSYSEESKYVDQGLRVNHTERTRDKILNKDDLTMVLNDKTLAGRIIGRVLLIDKDDSYAFNQRTQRIILEKNKFNPQFIYQLLNAPNNRNKIILQSQGNTQIYVNWSVISETEYFIPEVKEQAKIGKLFYQLDHLITLHQRKYDKLVNVKKSLLQTIFPSDSENTPKVRFQGFTEAWEQCELWELTIWDKSFNEVDKYKQLKTIKYPYVLADKLNSLENNTGNVLLMSTGTYTGFTTEKLAGQNLCEGEVVAIPWGGEANIKYWNGKFVTADNRIATSSDQTKLSNKFLYYWMVSNLEEIKKTYRGASIKHPSMLDVLNLKIRLC